MIKDKKKNFVIGKLNNNIGKPKSPHKMKRDVMKRVKSLNPTLAPRNLDQGSCWYDNKIMQQSLCGPLEYSLPNSKWGFFDECVTQRFFDRDLPSGTLIQYCDENNQVLEVDIYAHENSYQCHCIDISGELMTFSIGGPRHFDNNLPLENSPLWEGKNLAHYIHHHDMFRDCKYVYGSPLFRYHCEFPTNPSLKGDVVNNPDNWWEIDNRDSDIFEDADDYGYVAMQLTHLPKCIGYDVGNVLSYLPIYDLNIPHDLQYARKRFELTPHVVFGNFLHQSHSLPFKYRTDQVAVPQ